MSKAESSSTKDLMSVESFAQLPFLRPSQANSSASASASASSIRIFGIDVNSTPKTIDINTSSTTSISGIVVDPVRRFECHYCCRNFPTSQALGGHQNAHKRERQNAKRAHMQSTLAAAQHHYQYRLHQPPTPHYYYTSTRLGSLPGSPSQPITGSPLPSLWRVPHPLMSTENGYNFITSASSSSSSSMSSPSASSMAMSSSRFVCDSGAPRPQENVSLDLHL